MLNTMVLIRTDSFDKAMIALADLVRYGGMEIRGKPRIIPPALSDWAFEKIVGEKPKKKYRAHVIAQVNLPPAKAIGRLREIHPPAHIIVIPPESNVHKELLKMWGTFELLKGFYPPKKSGKGEESEK
ncbi:MAG: hypothetical protein DRP38_08550 [Thermotogae bacterium]|nr:MAG: hypothetical protein DRP38_08550 [Thermotogota bacterium]